MHSIMYVILFSSFISCARTALLVTLLIMDDNLKNGDKTVKGWEETVLHSLYNNIFNNVKPLPSPLHFGRVLNGFMELSNMKRNSETIKGIDTFPQLIHSKTWQPESPRSYL
jgi:hypothetical protein